MPRPCAIGIYTNLRFGFSLARRFIAGSEAGNLPARFTGLPGRLQPNAPILLKPRKRTVNRPADILTTAHPAVNGWAREKPINTGASDLCRYQWDKPVASHARRYRSRERETPRDKPVASSGEPSLL